MVARTFGLQRRAAGDGVADVGVVVLYWGAERISDEGLVELRRLYGGIPDAPVVRATVVRRGPKEGVVDQYLGFCRIWRCLEDACRGQDERMQAAERTRRIKCDIALLRSCGRAEDEIKEAIMDRYDLTPTYAQNFLDDDAEEEDELRRWLV